MIPDYTKQYWQYEYDVVHRTIAPLLVSWGVDLHQARVLDIGCGEAGGLAALSDRGAHCWGFDIDQQRIDHARAMIGSRAMTLAAGDLYRDPPFAGHRFDLVVLHDVFEHLENKRSGMQALAAFLTPSGKLLITFPPYFSAFGAHQQLLSTWYARLPFFHLLPFSLTFLLPRLSKEHQPFVDEIMKLGRLKMGMRHFERVVREAGMHMDRKQAYLLSPNYVRFRLPPVPAGPLARIPGLSELLCTAVIYLLSHR